MNILTKFFKSKIPIPELQYGRYSNISNSAEKQGYWEYAFKMYEAKKYQDASKSLLLYIENNSGSNVIIDIESKLRFKFEVIQGSKKILGKVNETGIFCEVKVAKLLLDDYSLFQQLLEENYYRNYTKYGLDDEGNICLMFQAEHINASPLRIFYALRDMAITSDKNDDIWIGQRPGIISIHSEHKLESPLIEKQQKFEYFQTKYKDLLGYFEKNREFLTSYPGAAAYLFLDFAFTMDYLIKPEGKMMRIFEDMVRSYSNNSLTNPGMKIDNIRQIFDLLADITKEEFYNEIYPTVYTFGTPAFTNHQSVSEVIMSETQNMQWYLDNQKDEIAVAIARYIVGYLFYSFTIPSYDRELLHLAFEIAEPDFFKRFNKPSYVDESGKPNKKKILEKINLVIKNQKNSNLLIDLNIQSLDFTNLPSFLKSYLYCIANFQLTKLKKS